VHTVFLKEEFGIAESNDIITILAGKSQIAVSVHVQLKMWPKNKLPKFIYRPHSHTKISLFHNQVVCVCCHLMVNKVL